MAKRKKTMKIDEKESTMTISDNEIAAEMDVDVDNSDLDNIDVLEHLPGITAKTATTRIRSIPKAVRDVIDDIWMHLDNGDIDTFYATIAYTVAGRAILDYDNFVSLLIKFGYNIKDICAFIDFVHENFEDDPTVPMIVLSKNEAMMCQDEDEFKLSGKKK